MVVGHNPGLQSLALLVAGSGSDKARKALSEKYPTGGLAVIDFDLPDWTEIRTRQRPARALYHAACHRRRRD